MMLSLIDLGLIIVGSLLLAAAGATLWLRWLRREPAQPRSEASPEDQRTDLESRQRIATLESRWQATAHHLAAALAVFGAGMIVAMILVFVLFSQLHASRVRSLREACERNRATVATATAQFPELASFFRRAFPYSNDCQADAETRAGRR